MDKIMIWFRNDLRVHDHEALFKAAQKTQSIVPIYCFDPRQFKENTLGLPKTGSFRAKFLLESVFNLKQKLKTLGADLIIKVGEPEKVIPFLAGKYKVNALYTSKEITSEEVKIEKALEKGLAPQKMPITYFWQSTLYHLEDLPFPVPSLPDVFTKFRKQVEKLSEVRSIFPIPPKLDFTSYETDQFPSLSDFGLEEEAQDDRSVLNFKGGEDEAIKRLNQYFWQGNHLKSYKETRNGLLGANYSSKFSPWLAHGCLSPRFIYEEVMAYEKERFKNSSTYWLIFELIWRDYFKFVAKKYGISIFLQNGIKQEPISTQFHKVTFDKWAKGKTGIPFIDANMIELNQTGFMSNRGRQNVASFLVKDLKLDWRAGANYFESKLVDYDPCSNWCNWNYVAGIGNDPREDRYFNILSQAKRYDPKGDYVKTWLPQLKSIPFQLVHTVGNLSFQQQEEYGLKLGGSYPHPIVDNSKWLKKIKV